MVYREVTMLEIKEVARLWLAGVPKKRIADQLGLDPKTVRRYVQAAAQVDLAPGQELTEEAVCALVSVLHTPRGRPAGLTRELCTDHRDFIEAHLRSGLRLTKIHRLLHRQGVQLPYISLYRFAVAELGFGQQAPTVAVADGEPGDECQLDTGWTGSFEPNADGRRSRFRSWIFTPGVSRYRFVYPVLQETTGTAIEACEAAWEFYDGIFRTLIPDNTKAIVDRADPLTPRFTAGFLEYAQARGFQIDPARSRHPRDKPRVERSVSFVRDDCFAGEPIPDLERARVRASFWSREEAGLRRHSRTGRLPREHFETMEQSLLLPAPLEPYDVPIWAHPVVARDQFAQVAKALYSLPTRLRGRTLTARADLILVRFYHEGQLVKTHPRKPPYGRSTDPSDFPEHKTAYAMRDVTFLQRQAEHHGEAIGLLAAKILEVTLPWTRMRRVYALLGLVRRYGPERVEAACRIALAADLDDVRRIERMILCNTPPPEATVTAPAVAGRFLRPRNHFTVHGGTQP